MTSNYHISNIFILIAIIIMIFTLIRKSNFLETFGVPVNPMQAQLEQRLQVLKSTLPPGVKTPEVMMLEQQLNTMKGQSGGGSSGGSSGGEGGGGGGGDGGSSGGGGSAGGGEGESCKFVAGDSKQNVDCGEGAYMQSTKFVEDKFLVKCCKPPPPPPPPKPAAAAAPAAT
jgi:hypothetical protein